MVNGVDEKARQSIVEVQLTMTKLGATLESHVRECTEMQIRTRKQLEVLSEQIDGWQKKVIILLGAAVVGLVVFIWTHQVR